MISLDQQLSISQRTVICSSEKLAIALKILEPDLKDETNARKR
jgi:hypothetical protein